MRSTNRKRNGPDEQAALEAVVRDALVSLGWLPPTSQAEVAGAEQTTGGGASLPEALREAEAIFARGDRPAAASVRLDLPAESDIDATLRRAARDGGTIPPEIEEKMRRDRQEAERQMEHGENGESPS